MDGQFRQTFTHIMIHFNFYKLMNDATQESERFIGCHFHKYRYMDIMILVMEACSCVRQLNLHFVWFITCIKLTVSFCMVYYMY